MKKRITEYRKRVDRLLADEEEKTYEAVSYTHLRAHET